MEQIERDKKHVEQKKEINQCQQGILFLHKYQPFYVKDFERNSSNSILNILNIFIYYEYYKYSINVIHCIDYSKNFYIVF